MKISTLSSKVKVTRKVVYNLLELQMFSNERQYRFKLFEICFCRDADSTANKRKKWLVIYQWELILFSVKNLPKNPM